MPRVDQSGRRQVRLCMSKISTPSRMAQMMASLDNRKASSNWGDQENLHRGLRKGLNGSMMSRNWA